jgi:uncharacterized membrane protein
MENLDKNTQAWYNVMGIALRIPGAKVNRSEFINNQFNKYCSQEELNDILNDGTIRAGIDITLLDKVANDVINYETNMVVGLSFAAGLPGGWAMAATIPGDIAQFFYHIFVIAQKLAYIYGWPEIDEKASDDFKSTLTLFVGIMSGVEVANQGIKEVTKLYLQKGVAKLATMKGLGNKLIYKIVAEVAKKLGVQMSKATFSKIVAKVVPVLGGILSGVLSLATFKPMAIKLKNKLRKDSVFMGKPFDV